MWYENFLICWEKNETLSFQRIFLTKFYIFLLMENCESKENAKMLKMLQRIQAKLRFQEILRETFYIASLCIYAVIGKCLRFALRFCTL